MLGRLTDPAVAHRRRWLTLLVLCLSLMVIGIDNTILNVAIPTLAKPTSAGGLGASASELQWIVDAYTIVFAGLLLTVGQPRRPLRSLPRARPSASSSSASARALSAFAPSATVLIGTRALMGIGARRSCRRRCRSSRTCSTTRRARQGDRRVGGRVGHRHRHRTHRRWRAAGALLVGLGVPRERADRRRGARRSATCSCPSRRTRTRGSSTPSASLLSIVGSSSCSGRSSKRRATGGRRRRSLGGFASAAWSSPAFFVWELHCANPMLDVRFFENPRFSAASGAITLAFLALFGTIFLLTQYTQQVLGYSTVEAGAVFLPQSIVLMIFAPMSTRWVRSSATRPSSRPGCSSSRVARADGDVPDRHRGGWVVSDHRVRAFGMAHVVAPATESIMGSLPRAKAGVGSAMNDTTRQVGGAVGVALLGSILASAFRPKVATCSAARCRGHSWPRSRTRLGSALGVARDVPAGATVRRKDRRRRPTELRQRHARRRARGGGDRGDRRHRRAGLAPGPGAHPSRRHRPRRARPGCDRTAVRAPRSPRTSSPRHRRPEADSLRRSSGSRSLNQSSIVLRE